MGEPMARTTGGGLLRDRSGPQRVTFLELFFDLVYVAGAVAIWWIFFSRAGEVTAAAIASSANPGRLGRTSSYIHAVMVAGVIVTAVGNDLVIAHPTGHTEWSWLAVILGGPALFVAGHSLLKYAVFGYVPRSRPIALLALAAMAPAMVLAPPLVVATAATSGPTLRYRRSP